jgi:protein-arginine kinase activator protein McsA
MRPSKRCHICKKVPPTTQVLMIGSAGYRRYPLCEKCAKATSAKLKAKQGGQHELSKEEWT